MSGSEVEYWHSMRLRAPLFWLYLLLQKVVLR
jgi:hypothetical protein